MLLVLTHVPSPLLVVVLMQLLRGVSDVPLWPDWDEAPADREPIAADEAFALLPWWLSGSLAHRGMQGFWSLSPPVQVGFKQACCVQTQGMWHAH